MFDLFKRLWLIGVFTLKAFKLIRSKENILEGVYLGKLKEFGKKVLFGGPQHQERKRLEKEAKDEAFKEEMAGYKAGLKAGAKQRGMDRGINAGKGKSGFGGFLEGAGRSMQAFDRGAGMLVGDMDFGGIGSGLNSDFTGIGGFGSEKPVRQRHRNRHNRQRRRGRR